MNLLLVYITTYYRSRNVTLENIQNTSVYLLAVCNCFIDIILLTNPFINTNTRPELKCRIWRLVVRLGVINPQSMNTIIQRTLPKALKANYVYVA